jgi:hypothetical protein
MKKITFKGSRPKGHPFPIVSWGIRLIEWSSISHNFVEFESEDLMFHAHFNDVKFEKASKYAETIHVEYSFDVWVTYKEYDQIMEYCKSIEGKKKGYFLQLFGVLLVAPLRWLGIKVSNPFKGIYTSKICSEICRYVSINILGFEEIEKAPKPENYYTTDFIKLMQKNLEISGQE